MHIIVYNSASPPYSCFPQFLVVVVGGGGEQLKKSNITLMLNQKIPDNSLSLQVLQHTLGPTRTRSRCGRW